MSNLSDFLGGGGGGGTPVNGKAILDLGGQVQYTDAEGKVWLKTGNVLTTGLENYPNATVKNRPILSTLTYDNISTSLGVGQVQSLIFKPDGTRFYVRSGTNFYQYDLSTPWDVSTKTLSSTFSYGPSYTSNAQAQFSFDNTGKYLFFVWSNQAGRIYTAIMSTPWDISTIGSNVFGTRQNNYVLEQDNDASTPFQLGGAQGNPIISKDNQYIYYPSLSNVLVKYRFYVPSSGLGANRLKFIDHTPFVRLSKSIIQCSSYERWFVHNSDFARIEEYDLNGYDSDTLNFNGNSINPTEVPSDFYLALKTDNSKLFIMNDSGTVYQYSLTTEDYIGIPGSGYPNEYLRIK